MWSVTRVLLTAHESPWMLDLAVAAQKLLAADGIDLRFWPIGPNAAAALSRRGVTSLFAPTIRRVPAAAHRPIAAWFHENTSRLLSGEPVHYHGVALDKINAYEARVRRAAASAATRLDLGRSGAGYVELFERYLDRLRPDLLIVWWGEWAWSRAGAAVAARSGIPVLYFERGPFPGSAQLDASGANGGASLADPVRWRSLAPAGLTRARQQEIDAFRHRFVSGGITGRPQPSRQSRETLARAHGLPLERDWLFFAPQETTDAVGALEDLAPAVQARPDITLVVKPHPAERKRAARLAAALRPLGQQARLIDDTHVHDLVTASAWTVTVSSAVGLEASLFDKPVLVLRPSLYSGKGFTCDASDHADVAAALDAVTSTRTLTADQQYARDVFCHYLISDYLLWATPDRIDASAGEMSRRIRQHLRPATGAPATAIPLDGWQREPMTWLSARDAFRDVRDRLRRSVPWRKPSDADV